MAYQTTVDTGVRLGKDKNKACLVKPREVEMQKGKMQDVDFARKQW